MRQGLRIIGRSPAFTAAIALTLALGVGANAAVFSIVNTLLLRPLPVANPSNLYVLTTVHQDNEQPHNVSWADYQDYRSATTVFSDLAVCYAAYALWARFSSGAVITGWTSLLISVLLIGGIQMLMLGIIGEYLGRSLTEIKSRPAYVLREHNIPSA